YTTDLAQSQAAEAKKAIAGLSDGEHKQALLFLADYSVERSY
ncbi:MAG: octaprenyl diphosphate synthase, partial [Gammaproteobacteria bacterium]|nr:octaprenyl diphosphate synthase [Gammaproteobacteria bacterium]